MYVKRGGCDGCNSPLVADNHHSLLKNEVLPRAARPFSDGENQNWTLWFAVVVDRIQLSAFICSVSGAAEFGGECALMSTTRSRGTFSPVQRICKQQV